MRFAQRGCKGCDWRTQFDQTAGHPYPERTVWCVNDLLLLAKGNGLYKLDPETGKLSLIKEFPTIITDFKVINLESEKVVVVLTEDFKLLVMSGSKEQEYDLSEIIDHNLRELSQIRIISGSKIAASVQIQEVQSIWTPEFDLVEAPAKIIPRFINGDKVIGIISEGDGNARICLFDLKTLELEVTSKSFAYPRILESNGSFYLIDKGGLRRIVEPINEELLNPNIESVREYSGFNFMNHFFCYGSILWMLNSSNLYAFNLEKGCKLVKVIRLPKKSIKDINFVTNFIVFGNFIVIQEIQPMFPHEPTLVTKILKISSANPLEKLCQLISRIFVRL